MEICHERRKTYAAPQEAEYLAWFAENNTTLSMIILLFIFNYRRYISSCQTAKEAWDRLQEVHRISLTKQWLNLKMSDGGNVVQHMKEFFALVDR